MTRSLWWTWALADLGLFVAVGVATLDAWRTIPRRAGSTWAKARLVGLAALTGLWLAAGFLLAWAERLAPALETTR